jgi:cytochrome c
MRMQQSIFAKASLARGARPALLALAALSIVLPIGATSAFAQLRGHGGPVRALAISADGLSAISGSFDSTAIRWSLTRNAAEQVLRFHSDAVNAVAWLRDGRTATAGADGRVAIWTSGKVIRRRSWRLRRRLMAQRSLQRHGITRCGSGRSRVALRACSTSIRRT